MTGVGFLVDADVTTLRYTLPVAILIFSKRGGTSARWL